MGGTSVTYNVYHAVHNGQLNLWLALLYGIAAVFAAAMLSHIVAVVDSAWVMKTITYLVMLGAMTLSIGATASVVAPAAGPWMRWLFGAVLDAAALLALRVILESRRRQAADATELTHAVAAAEQAGAAATEARAAAVRLQGELDALRADLATERERTSSALRDAPGNALLGAPGDAPGTLLQFTAGVHPQRQSAPRSATAAGAPDPLNEFAEELAAGRLPSGREIARRMHTSQDKARTEIQPVLQRWLDAQPAEVDPAAGAQ